MSGLSAAGFDKFAWLKALRTDPSFTDREVRIAMAICTDFTRRNGDGWMVELDVLAAAAPGKMTRNRLKFLLGKLTAEGYLIETARTGGGRAVTARRSHDLAMPGKPAPVQGRVYSDTRTGTEAGIQETRPSRGVNPPLQGVKPAPVQGRKVASEQQIPPPPGTSSGTSSGTRVVSKCGGHPCAICDEIRKDIDQCEACDDAGRLPDGPDGTAKSDCREHGNFRMHVKPKRKALA